MRKLTAKERQLKLSVIRLLLVVYILIATMIIAAISTFAWMTVSRSPGAGNL